MKHPVIDLLITVARTAADAMDEGMEIPNGDVVIDGKMAKALSDALDALDALPDDQPGYTMGPAAKAQWALRGDTEEVKKLRAALENLMEMTEPPDKNCSCHIHPPCNDCVEYEGVREAHEQAKAALVRESE